MSIDYAMIRDRLTALPYDDPRIVKNFDGTILWEESELAFRKDAALMKRHAAGVDVLTELPYDHACLIKNGDGSVNWAGSKIAFDDWAAARAAADRDASR